HVCSFSFIGHLPSSPLFPYTTLFRSWGPKRAQPIVFHHGWPLSSDDWDAQMLFFHSHGYRVVAHDRRGHGRSAQVDWGHDMDHRSEEHTSELQSRENLVCRLLLEKKK